MTICDTLQSHGIQANDTLQFSLVSIKPQSVASVPQCCRILVLQHLRQMETTVMLQQSAICVIEIKNFSATLCGTLRSMETPVLMFSATNCNPSTMESCDVTLVVGM